MKITIVGAGSLGLLLAGLLAQGREADVRLVSRTKEQADHVQAEGIAVKKEGETIATARIPCTSFETAAAHPWKADWVLLTTKQTHWTDPLLKYLISMIRNGARLLCFQNGIGHVERLDEAGFPLDRMYVAVTTEGARKETGRTVAHTGVGVTALGLVRTGDALGPLQEPCRLLEAAGLETAIVPDIEQIVWRKLVINSVINPLTAVLRVRNGELASSSSFRHVMRALYNEACFVVEKVCKMDREMLWEQLLEVCERTSGNTSSMLQDVLEGRETEIDSITGALIRSASKQRVPVPTHEAVYHLVLGLRRRDA